MMQFVDNFKTDMNIATKSAPAQKATRIGKVKAAQMISDSNGRIFTATFIKGNGEIRVMNCRRGVTKGVKGSPKAINTEALGLITVYDMQSKGFKKLNLQNLTGLKINKQIYKVK